MLLWESFRQNMHASTLTHKLAVSGWAIWYDLQMFSFASAAGINRCPLSLLGQVDLMVTWRPPSSQITLLSKTMLHIVCPVKVFLSRSSSPCHPKGHCSDLPAGRVSLKWRSSLQGINKVSHSYVTAQQNQRTQASHCQDWLHFIWPLTLSLKMLSRVIIVHLHVTEPDV